jgi:hypothetical protein
MTWRWELPRFERQTEIKFDPNRIARFTRDDDGCASGVLLSLGWLLVDVFVTLSVRHHSNSHLGTKEAARGIHHVEEFDLKNVHVERDE